MKQLSLLDLKPERGPSAKLELDWYIFGKKRFQQKADSFRELYDSSPIFWKQIKKRFDLFQTSPWQGLIIDRESGELMDTQGFEKAIWDSDPKNFSSERRNHLSPQIRDFLLTEQEKEGWRAEILQDLGYHPEKRGAIFELLAEHPVHFYVDMGPYRGIFRVFAPPQTVMALYMQGAEQGIFI